MEEYHKIETLFKREDAKPHNMILGEYRDPTVESLKDVEWIFTEKIDGTNVRVFWDGHKVTFGGRTDNAQMPTFLFTHLEETFGGSVNEQVFEEHFGNAEVMLIGEGYGPKIQSGGDYRSDVGFILFDIHIGGMWLERSSVEKIAKYFDVPVVPVVLRSDLETAIEFVKEGFDSLIAEKTRPAEGLVGVPANNVLDRRGHRVIVKLKHNDLSKATR